VEAGKNNMDPQKTKKRGAIGLGALSGTLGLFSHASNRYKNEVIKAAAAAKVPLDAEALFNMKVGKYARNITGVGAVGTGIGAAVLAAKYHKNKKKAKIAGNSKVITNN
jgi:hypothetical protein